MFKHLVKPNNYSTSICLKIWSNFVKLHTVADGDI